VWVVSPGTADALALATDAAVSRLLADMGGLPSLWRLDVALASPATAAAGSGDSGGGGSGGGGGGGAPVPDGRVGFSFLRPREAVLDGKLDGVMAVAGLCAACPLTALTLPGVAQMGLPALLTRAAGGRPLPRGRHLWPPRRAGRRTDGLWAAALRNTTDMTVAPRTPPPTSTH